MANRGPLAAVLIVDPIIAGRSANADGAGAGALAPYARGDGSGTNGGTLTGGVVLTVAQLLTGFYSANGGAASRTLTLPSFANLTNATTGLLKGVGDRFDVTIANVGATDNLVITGVTNVSVLVADASDATITPTHVAIVSLIRISSTDVVACVALYG
jgi:hypothetical protein